MDLRKLVYFATIAECGSFTRAASKLHIAQSALSRQIRLLEEELELELFMRIGRSIRLTDAGEALLEHAYDLIRGLERAKREMQARVGKPRGTVQFGVPPSLGPPVVPQLVEGIHKDFPQLDIRVREATSVVLEEWLADGRIDLALISHEPTTPGINGKVLVHEKIGLIGRTDIISVAENAGFAAFAHFPLLLTLQVGLLIHDVLRQASLMFPKTVEIDAIQAVKSLVLRGSGLTIMPVAFFKPEIDRGELRAVPIQGASLFRPITLISSATRPMTGAADVVARRTCAEVGRLAEAGLFTIPSRTRASVIFLPATGASHPAGATPGRRRRLR